MTINYFPSVNKWIIIDEKKEEEEEELLWKV